MKREITSKKIRGNNVEISAIEITSKKNTLKKRRYFDHRNYVKKSKWKPPAKFSTSEIIPKKVNENNVDFSTIEIASENVSGTMWIFQSPKIYRRSTWKWRGNL